MSHLPIVDAPIDVSVVIPCPARKLAERQFEICRAANFCPSCEHFRGVAQMAEDTPGKPPLPWHKKYVIRCAHMVERRTTIFAVNEGD